MDMTLTASRKLDAAADQIRRCYVPSKPGVYKIVNLTTGDCYVGATRNLRRRKMGHAAKISTGTTTRSFVEAMSIGPDFWRMRVLELCDVGMLAVREAHWIKKLKPSLNVRPTEFYRAQVSVN